MKVSKEVLEFLGYQFVPDYAHYKQNILAGDEEYIVLEDRHFPCWMKKVESIDQSYYNEAIAIVDRIDHWRVE